MAYITTETVAKIRKALKAKFPEIKFSIRKRHHSEVSVTIIQSPYFDNGVDLQVNHYWIDRSKDFNDEQKAILKGIDETIRVEGDYYDKSDAMSDYFDTAFYYNISVGNYDKPHVLTD